MKFYTRSSTILILKIAAAVAVIASQSMFASLGFEDECSAFISRQVPAGNAPFMVFAKNRDRPSWDDEGRPTLIAEGQMIADFTTPGGIRVVGLKTKGARVTVGANSAGLAAAINMAPGRTRRQSKSVSSFNRRCMALARAGAIFVPSAARKLDAQSALERFGTVRELSRSVRAGLYRGHKLLLAADNSGSIGTFELVALTLSLPSGKRLTRWAVTSEVNSDSDGSASELRTNHFTLPGTSVLNFRSKNRGSTFHRLERLSGLTGAGPVDFDGAARILSDHRGYPSMSICNHRDRLPGSRRGGKTVSSAILEVPGRGRPWICRFHLGPPCMGGSWVEMRFPQPVQGKMPTCRPNGE